MKVKVGDRVYNGSEQPVMVILTDQDKRNIAAMHRECTKYCEAPDGMSAKDIEVWMNKDC